MRKARANGCTMPAMRPSGSRAESRRQSHQEHRPLEGRLLAAPRAFFMKNLLCCFAVSLFLIPGLALAAAIPDPPTIDAKSYAWMDYDSGELIAASNPDDKVAPASITTVMTTYIVFDEIRQKRLSPDDKENGS